MKIKEKRQRNGAKPNEVYSPVIKPLQAEEVL